MTGRGEIRRRTGRRWLLAIALLSGAGAVAAVVGIWHLPPRMYPEADAAEARAALQGGLLTAAAALLAVAGGLIALDETQRANAETKRANEAADARERAANENTHVRELYTRAVDQLGSDNITVRLGGIYALERIATDSPPDQRSVVEVLSAFVRVRCSDLPQGLAARIAAEGERATPVYPAADIRAAVQVLARLPEVHEVSRADLTGAALIGPAGLARLDLSGANLAGVWLHGADFTRAILLKANLAGAHLRGAILTEANLRDGADLTATHLTGADLGDALLEGASLSLSFNLSVLQGLRLLTCPWSSRLVG